MSSGNKKLELSVLRCKIKLDGMPGGIPELGVVGGRCEVGEDGELWNRQSTVPGREQRGSVMRLGHLK